MFQNMSLMLQHVLNMFQNILQMHKTLSYGFEQRSYLTVATVIKRDLILKSAHSGKVC